MGSGKWEVKWEVGSGKWEVGSKTASTNSRCWLKTTAGAKPERERNPSGSETRAGNRAGVNELLSGFHF